MNHIDRIRICERCKNRKVNPKVGMTCGLTDEVPAFEDTCDFYQVDPVLDFQMRMIEDNAARNKQNTKRILYFMLIGLPLIILLGWGAQEGFQWWKNHQIEKEAEHWGLLLEEDLEENAGKGVLERFDLYQILNRATHDGKLSAQIVSSNYEAQGLKQILVQYITLNFGDGIHIKQLNINVKDERAFILYRVSYPSATVDYLELELKRVDGQLKIVDAFSFLHGEYLNETVYRLIPRDDGSIPGNFQFYSYVRNQNSAFECENLLAQKNTYGATNILNSMHSMYRDERFYLIASANLYRLINPEHANEKLDALLKKSNDVRYQAFLKLLKMSNGGKPTNLDKELATLKKYLGNDAYLQFLETKIRLKAKKESCESLKGLYNQLSRERFYLDARLECDMDNGNISEAKKTVEKIIDVYPHFTGYQFSHYLSSNYPELSWD